MVLVDYLQRIPLEDHTGDEVSRVTIVTETLKDLALELECPMVCISAADRESLGAGQRMRTRDLRGSSALAYEADMVMILSSREQIVSRDHLVHDLGRARRSGAGPWSRSRRTGTVSGRSSSRCSRTSSTAVSTRRPRS
ncbi:MAG: DnaB-like helicase C-terminal domain-containing protein [Ornithinibacter sp.]